MHQDHSRAGAYLQSSQLPQAGAGAGIERDRDASRLSKVVKGLLYCLETSFPQIASRKLDFSYTIKVCVKPACI